MSTLGGKPYLVNVHTFDADRGRDKIVKRVHVETEEKAEEARDELKSGLRAGEWIEIVCPLPFGD